MQDILQEARVGHCPHALLCQSWDGAERKENNGVKCTGPYQEFKEANQTGNIHKMNSKMVTIDSSGTNLPTQCDKVHNDECWLGRNQSCPIWDCDRFQLYLLI